MRIVGAIIAGYAVWTLVWLVGGAALMALFGVNPAQESFGGVAYLASTLALSFVCSLLGGAVCGAIARGKTTAGWVLGALLLVTGFAVQAIVWDAMPIWYHIIFLVMLEPLTIVGFSFASRKTARRTR